MEVHMEACIVIFLWWISSQNFKAAVHDLAKDDIESMFCRDIPPINIATV